MLFQESEIKEREDNFYKNLIRLYLRYGSVDEVFRNTNYSLPISYPGMHHLIKRWGIIKSAGPNSKLSEALTVLTLLSDSKIPLERLYKSLPPSFKTSLSTMHRILHNVKEGVTRRCGTALVITADNQPDRVLIGRDMDHRRNYTLPMTYSVHNEDPHDSILRVLQQEVFSENAVEKKMPKGIIPQNPRPFMFLKIADIKVAVYSLKLLPSTLKETQFSSFKVTNHSLTEINTILNGKYEGSFRSGVKNIVNGYKKHLLNDREVLIETSDINLALLRA